MIWLKSMETKADISSTWFERDFGLEHVDQLPKKFIYYDGLHSNLHSVENFKEFDAK